MNCSEAKFYENYLISDFHTNTVISRRVTSPAHQDGFQNRDKIYKGHNVSHLDSRYHI